MFFILFPKNEFKELINQYFFILNISDYLLGIEYPEPFSYKSTRYTKALLILIFAGVFLVNYIFSKKKNESLQSKFLLFFLFVSSIIFFKSGLMRSDTPHIKYTSGIYTFLIFFFISYHLIKITNKIKVLNKFFIFFENRKFFLIISSLICFLEVVRSGVSTRFGPPLKICHSMTTLVPPKLIENKLFVNSRGPKTVRHKRRTEQQPQNAKRSVGSRTISFF